MNQQHRPGFAFRSAELLIHRTCRRLPEPDRDDRELEWLAEAEAVASVPTARFRPSRSICTVWFAVSLALNRATCRVPSTPRHRNRLRATYRTFNARFHALTAFVGIVSGGVVSIAFHSGDPSYMIIALYIAGVFGIFGGVLAVAKRRRGKAAEYRVGGSQ